MIECEITKYQPGTGTRHILIHGIIKDETDARRLCCDVGSLFLVWEGVGAYEFSKGTMPGYLAEKFKIENFMLDAIALTQFVRSRLGIPMMAGAQVNDTIWEICPECTMPIYKKKKDSKCLCKEYGT